MCDVMTYPDNMDYFIEQYGIRDTEEVYTNGLLLIPVFRVKQMLDHYFRERTCHIVTVSDDARDWPENQKCDSCGEWVASIWTLNYCPNCGARVIRDNEPVEVWQQASADDVTCHEGEE